MNCGDRHLHFFGRFAPFLRAAALLVASTIPIACGGPVGEDLVDSGTGRRSATLRLNPQLDRSGVTFAADQAPVRFDELMINLAEVRLLGTDPRIPAEGVALLTEDQLLRGEQPALALQLPEALLDDPDLAVFVRVGPSPDLDGASIQIHGQFEDAQLASSTVEATDPDVDPMDGLEPPGRVDCATDPDVDPMACRRRLRPSSRGAGQRFEGMIPFELRDSAVVDLVTTLNDEGDLEVTLGIPLGRWLHARPRDLIEAALSLEDNLNDARRVVLRPRANELDERRERPMPGSSFGYRLD